MDLRTAFENSLDVDDYIEILGDNKPLHELHYKKAEIDIDLPDTDGLKVLVITEPWCSDSTAILPVLVKLLENTDIPIRIARRDENPELMDMFMTNGARAIPVILVLYDDYDVAFRLGPRPQPAQAIFEEQRLAINCGEIEKSEVIKKIRTFYAKDRGKSIAAEFVEKLKKESVKV